MIVRRKSGTNHLACRRTFSRNSICSLSLSLACSPLRNISRESLSSICTASSQYLSGIFFSTFRCRPKNFLPLTVILHSLVPGHTIQRRLCAQSLPQILATRGNAESFFLLQCRELIENSFRCRILLPSCFYNTFDLSQSKN